MSTRREAFQEYLKLWEEARKKEEELLAIPRKVAQGSGTSVDLLFTAADSSKLKVIFAKLQTLEKQRDAARARFMSTL